MESKICVFVCFEMMIIKETVQRVEMENGKECVL